MAYQIAPFPIAIQVVKLLEDYSNAMFSSFAITVE